MNNLSGNVHIVAGNAQKVGAVLALLEREGFRVKGNPDLYVRNYGTFGIDDAHELQNRAASRAFESHRVFVISCDAMTREAQNALLKTLEEPSAAALFFFIVPLPEMLLPTLLSRGQILQLHDAAMEKQTSSIEAGAFLKATAAKRLDILKPLLEKGEDDKRDLGAIFDFLSSLEIRLSEHFQEEAAREAIEAVYRARTHIGDRGALVKPLLEQVALLAPQI